MEPPRPAAPKAEVESRIRVAPRPRDEARPSARRLSPLMPTIEPDGHDLAAPRTTPGASARARRMSALQRTIGNSGVNRLTSPRTNGQAPGETLPMTDRDAGEAAFGGPTMPAGGLDAIAEPHGPADARGARPLIREVAHVAQQRPAAAGAPLASGPRLDEGLAHESEAERPGPHPAMPPAAPSAAAQPAPVARAPIPPTPPPPASAAIQPPAQPAITTPKPPAPATIKPAEPPAAKPPAPAPPKVEPAPAPLEPSAAMPPKAPAAPEAAAKGTAPAKPEAAEAKPPTAAPEGTPAAKEPAPEKGKPAAPGKGEAKGSPAAKEKAAEGATEGKAGAPEAADKATPKAAASPQADPGFQAVAARVHHAAAGMSAHPPAHAKAAEAQAAAVSPPAEAKSKAASAQVDSLDQDKPKPFDRAAFTAALLAKIAEVAPKNLGEAEKFKKSGKVAAVKGALTTQVAEGKAQAQGDIPQKVQQEPDPSGIPPKPVTPLPPAEAGPAPPDVGASAAVPKPRPESEVSLQTESASLDNQMAGAGVTEEQLRESNEPAFQGALDAKRSAQADAASAPAAFRQDERGMLAQGQAEAKAAAQGQLAGMHGGRGALLGQVAGQQVDAKGQDEQERTRISGEIQKIYDETKARVEARLKKLDDDVNAEFEKGASEAQRAFEDEVDAKITDYKFNRYLVRTFGAALWLKDLFLGLPDEVNAFYATARENYIARMTAVLGSIAGTVETGLNEAKAMVADGRRRIQEFVQGLPTALQGVGQEAAKGIQSKFDQLEKSVDDKQSQLIDSLAQKYAEKLQQVDARIDEMKKANRGLVAAARDAIGGVIAAIIEMKNLLVSALAKAAEAIGIIIRHPIDFLGNLVAAVKQGFLGFIAKIGTYLEQGLLGWLFGALAQAGIELPKSFDLKGILSLVLQVLGLTYRNIRSRAVRILGEKVVSTLETTAEIFIKLVTEGPGALWEWIKEKLSDLKETVLGSIRDFVITKVITAGVTWILSLLNPASAFIKACKAIYDIVMFFIEHGKEILVLVNAILDSIVSIAKGAIGAAAAYVEATLAKAIPLVIGFLASLLGLGGISEKIRSIIEKIQEPVNAAIDWVIKKAVDLVKAAGKLLGLGKKEEKAETEDPKHDLAVEAGLAALAEEEKRREEGGAIDREDAEDVAQVVRQQHPIFKSITVVDGQETWDYDYVASPGKKVKGGKKDEDKRPDISSTFSFYPETHGDSLYWIATGELGVPGKVKKHRSPSAQRRVSGGKGEDAGHLIGNRFGAPGDERNLGLQNWKTNRFGTWKQLENDWAAILKSGGRVKVKVIDMYRLDENRPYNRVVEWEATIEGTKSSGRLLFPAFHTERSREAQGVPATEVGPAGGKLIPGPSHWFGGEKGEPK